MVGSRAPLCAVLSTSHILPYGLLGRNDFEALSRNIRAPASLAEPLLIGCRTYLSHCRLGWLSQSAPVCSTIFGAAFATANFADRKERGNETPWMVNRGRASRDLHRARLIFVHATGPCRLAKFPSQRAPPTAAGEPAPPRDAAGPNRW
jgi:hypothetical protein